MAQHDYVIANGTGAAVRSDLNNALAAIVSQNSGATAPATTYAFQFWADTTTGLLKLRNSANSAWVTLFQLDGEWSTLPVENGTAAAPSIYFKDSGTNTGFYSPGTDQIGISTAGTSRLTIDANGNLAVDTNTLYVDSTNNRVGIGTTSPSGILHVNAASNAYTYSSTTTNSVSGFGGCFSTTGYDLGTSSNHPVTVYSNNAPRVTVTNGGLVGIGTASPAHDIDLRKDAAGSTVTLRVRNDNAAADSNSALVLDTPNGVWGLRALRTGGRLAVDIGGSEKAAIDTSGRLLVGTSSSLSANRTFQVAGTGGEFLSASATAGDLVPLILSRTRGTIGSPTVVSSGDGIGSLTYKGYDGTNYIDAAGIKAEVDGTPGTNDMPGRLVFSTTADGASSPTERLRIANNGAWGLGGANYGSSSQVLTSNGSGSAPTWQTVTAAAPAALSTASGSAPSYSARAWVNFNGTGTVAIRASGNVSSITDNGIGDYTVNFTTAMSDANYSVVGLHQWDQSNTSSGSGIFLNIARYAAALSSGSVRVFGSVGSGATLYDGTTITISIFR